MCLGDAVRRQRRLQQHEVDQARRAALRQAHLVGGYASTPVSTTEHPCEYYRQAALRQARLVGEYARVSCVLRRTARSECNPQTGGD